MTTSTPIKPRQRRKLPSRYAAILTPLIVSTLMSCIVSAVSTAKGLGLSADFVSHWISAWGASWLVAFPALLVILPFVRRIVGVLVAPADR